MVAQSHSILAQNRYQVFTLKTWLNSVNLQQGWATSGFIRNSGYFFFLPSWKKKTWARQVDYFYRGKNGGMMRHYCRPATHLDLIRIPRFFRTILDLEVSWFHVWKYQFFCFVSKLEKQQGVSCCRMSHVSKKPTKCGLKINFMIGWIDGLGWILCTPRLSEWSRLGLASLSPRPSLTWCHSSADPRNSAVFLKILPFFLRLQRSGPLKSGKCKVQNI